jgi:hypothetical protein
MPDPQAMLIIEEEQYNMKRLTLHVEVVNPDNPSETIIDQVRVAYRHADSNYEEE